MNVKTNLNIRKILNFFLSFRFVIYNIALSFLLSGCSMIIGKVFYGVQKPKVETETSLLSYLQKKKLSTDHVFCVPIEAFKETFSLGKGQIPEVFIFNKKGEYIPYGDEWACNANAFDFIANLNDTTNYTTSDLIHRDSLFANFRNLDSTKLSSETLATIKERNFVVVTFWAKYIGKLNKTKIREWEKQAKENTNTKITFVKLNLDIQEWWNIKQKT